MADEYKKYDSKSTFVAHHVRLTADAKPLGDTTKVTFVNTSRLDKDSDMWIDAIASPSDTLAAQLKKGDTISVEGFLTMQKWGDNNDKVSFTLRFAKLHYPLDLLKTLQERASVSGGKRTASAGRRREPDPTDDLPF